MDKKRVHSLLGRFDGIDAAYIGDDEWSSSVPAAFSEEDESLGVLVGIFEESEIDLSPTSGQFLGDERAEDDFSWISRHRASSFVGNGHFRGPADEVKDQEEKEDGVKLPPGGPEDGCRW